MTVVLGFGFFPQFRYSRPYFLTHKSFWPDKDLSFGSRIGKAGTLKPTFHRSCYHFDVVAVDAVVAVVVIVIVVVVVVVVDAVVVVVVVVFSFYFEVSYFFIFFLSLVKLKYHHFGEWICVLPNFPVEKRPSPIPEEPTPEPTPGKQTKTFLFYFTTFPLINNPCVVLSLRRKFWFRVH